MARKRTERRKAERKAAKQARKTARQPQFSPPPLSQARMQALLSAGVTTVELSDHWKTVLKKEGISFDDHFVLNAADGWAIDPWLWTVGDFTEQKTLLPAPLAIYVCRDYQAAVFPVTNPGGGWPGMWHLSIKRRDREPIDENRWRILQHIKNTLLGEEHEAVEVYPAESRLVDTANQYHLWCFKESGQQWPFGFTERYVTSTESHGSKQRPLPLGTSLTPDPVFVQGMDALLGKEAK